MNILKPKSLLAVFVGLLVLAFGSSGCRTAHQAVDKSGRVLEHGARKVERHLPD